jgi:anti-sigma factor (TIGR02949 family)
VTTIQRDLDCEQALARLFDFLDHEIEDGEERAAMQHHLATCRGCFSRAHFEQRLKDRMRELQRDAAPPQAGERIRRLLRKL